MNKLCQNKAKKQPKKNKQREEMKRAGHLLGRSLRETGQALDRVGLTVSGKEIFKDTLSRHRQVMNLFDKVSL